MDREAICLDSCFIIDFLKGEKSAIDIHDKHKDCNLFISDITIFEVCRSILSSKTNKLNSFLEVIETIQVLPATNLFALEAAEITADLKKKGIIIDDSDCLIAGLMLRNGVTKIITKNTKHFSKITGITAIGY